MFAGAAVRPWGILTVRIDITDETTTAFVYVYTNRSKANLSRIMNEFQSDYVSIFNSSFTFTLKNNVSRFRIPVSK